MVNMKVLLSAAAVSAASAAKPLPVRGSGRRYLTKLIDFPMVNSVRPMMVACE